MADRLDGETNGLREVDIGNLPGYFSAEVGDDLMHTLDLKDYAVVQDERCSLIL